MAGSFRERLLPFMDSYWSRVPYRTPLIITTCTAILVTPYVWRRMTYVPRLLPLAPRDYHYRETDDEKVSDILTLPDGRKVGYAQYGDPNGRPIIVLHGILGSRLENELFDDNARDLGARIIGIERPGMGLSSPDPRPLTERRVIDHAKDVEALAVHLQLKEYAVLGMSGGGPYALGCARALPSSPSKPILKAATVVTGQGLPDMSQSWPRPLLFLNQKLDLRWLIKWMFGRAPEWNLDLSDEKRKEVMRQNFDLNKAHPADVETARMPDYPDMLQIFLRSSRQAVAQGWQGFADDAAIISADPGFRVEDIPADLPVQLWYGTDDTNIAPQAGSETAERLRLGGNKDVELHMEPGETHGSIQVKYQRRILAALLKAMDRSAFVE